MSEYRIIRGNSLEVLRAMADAGERFSAIICDPPYGIAFMGREWDDPSAMLGQIADGDKSAGPLARGGTHTRGYADHDGRAFQRWCEEWARHAFELLPPGGHLVAFGATRAIHRMTCAVEDVGFEIRDMAGYLYSKGFPKSMWISDAIDKKRHDRDQVLKVTAWIREARDSAKLTNAAIDQAFGFAGMATHWTTQASQPAVPTLEQVPQLLDALGLTLEDVPDEIRDLLWTLNGRKGQPGEAWAKREVVGQHKYAAGAAQWRAAYDDRDGGLDAKPITAPHSDEAKAWAGWGTQLKPAWEVILIARKPLAGTYVDNVRAHGVGALNIDACRIGDELMKRTASDGTYKSANGSMAGHNTGRIDLGTAEGRWPTNILHDGSPAVLDAFAAFGESQSKKRTGKRTGVYGEFAGQDNVEMGHDDAGTAARFFPSVGPDDEDLETEGLFWYGGKASTADREEGLDDLPKKSGGELCYREDGAAGLDTPSAGAGRGGGRANWHPTVKSTPLMRWLVDLLVPPGGSVLDPFLGSGSTGKACAMRGDVAFTGIELSPDYHAIASRRIRHAAKGLAHGGAKGKGKAKPKKPGAGEAALPGIG